MIIIKPRILKTESVETSCVKYKRNVMEIEAIIDLMLREEQNAE